MSLTPIALFLLVPLNVLLIIYNEHSRFYIILLVLQLLFYAGGSYGYYLSTKSVKNKLLYIPYYFLFMNINVIKGFFYFIRKNKNDGTWERYAEPYDYPKYECIISRSLAAITGFAI